MRAPVSVLACSLLCSLAACSCGDGAASTDTSGSTGGAGGGGATSSLTGAGPVAVSSSATTAAGSGSSSSGGGGGDPGWVPIPWWKGGCAAEVATNPAAAFPRPEWETWPSGPPGTEVLKKTWDDFNDGAPAVSDVRRVGNEYELALFTGLESGDSREVVLSPDGPRAAYRTPPGSPCLLRETFIADDGHWTGVQWGEGNLGTFVFQPNDAPPAAAEIVPAQPEAQGGDALEEVLAIERSYSAGLVIFDRRVGSVHESPPALATNDPIVVSGGVLYLRTVNINDPEVWFWNRATGTFGPLLDGGAGYACNGHAADGALAWFQGPAFDEEQGVWPPGTVFTSPFAPTPEGIVPTARWSGVPTTPLAASAMGGGYYVVEGTDRQIYVLRLRDGRRFVVPVPDDGFQTDVTSIPHVDEHFIFVRVDTQFFRISLDALGEGMPPE